MTLRETYITGDATQPVGDGDKIIVHCCNNIGAWGAGFVVALSKRWASPEADYRRQFFNWGLELGFVGFVPVEKDIVVANLVGQEGTRKQGIKRPVRYDAISDGFDKVAAYAELKNSTVHMPRIGCGLAGGDWQIIARLIDESFLQQGVPVTVYDFA